MAPPTRRSARQAAAASAAAAASSAATVTSTPQRSSSNSKKRNNVHRSPKSSASPTKKTKLTNFAAAVTDVETAAGPLGVIDLEADVEGEIMTFDGANSEPCDVMLVLVDPAKNMDKYFILQLIKKSGGGFAVYTRWGRTGARGQALQQDFDEVEKAKDCFFKKFEQKTGLSWEDREESSVCGKYRYILQDFESKRSGFTGATWQYWVDDGVDGKSDGWYDYDKEGSVQTERLFQEFAKNSNLANRWVDSGAWTYNVDLVNMTQTNVKHPAHMVRRIRRCPVGVEMPDDPPTTSPATPARTGISAAKVVAPVRARPAAAAAKTEDVEDSEEPSGASSRPPVDPDVSLYGRDASDFVVVAFADDPTRWYDAVLNQCDITASNNNNKFYRIQMLLESSSGRYFVWQKWGRVGETAKKSSSALKGPYPDEEKALKEYGAKFKAKSGNDYDVKREEFVTKSGKYTLIQIDNNVNVSPTANFGTSVKSEYEESKLDPKTQELVQVLFSKEMRDEALTNFNIDLKRLPLGVPSQQQIQQGVEILKQIEEKLKGSGSGTSSLDQLSSQFYTAIPHSFGRARPPVINTTEKLQSRFDMCDILLDIYSTSETIRQLEEDKCKSKADILPNPLDQQYNTLHADLSLLNKNSQDYKTVATFFDKTKGQHSRSQLLDVWRVDREGEGKRFQKYARIQDRRLLFHGTNIAVVAPILTSGLRIMPHSGGRVGAGIYLASLQEKSAQYTSGYGAKFACMFLCEAALGKMHTVDKDGHHASSLKKAPKGYDSVHAVGKLVPKSWGEMKIDGKMVSVPTDAAEERDTESDFYHDEFLCYDESQVRIRYILTVRQ